MHQSDRLTSALAAEPEQAFNELSLTAPVPTPFDQLREWHGNFLRTLRFVGWRDPVNEVEQEYLSDFAEEYLRTALPDFAACDVEGYGKLRAKVLTHNTMVRLNQGKLAEPIYEFQALLEVRDHQGDWIILDNDGNTISLRNAVCMHIQGPDGGVQFTNVLYSEAALTEVLFNAEYKINPLPAHFNNELKRALVNFSSADPLEPEPTIHSMRFNWRKREVQLTSSLGTFVVYPSCHEGGNLSFDIFRTGKAV